MRTESYPSSGYIWWKQLYFSGPYWEGIHLFFLWILGPILSPKCCYFFNMEWWKRH